MDALHMSAEQANGAWLALQFALGGLMVWGAVKAACVIISWVLERRQFKAQRRW